MNRRGKILDGDLLIIGHRGASAHAPENTLAAFDLALQEGADGIEFDVRLARDRVPVVKPDPTLRRTAPRDGLVESPSSEDMCSPDPGTPFNRRNPARAQVRF